MGLTKLAIYRPLAILMLILGLVLLGYVSYTRMRVDRLPNISFNFVSVGVSYPGAGSRDTEELVVKPLEAAVAGLPGIFSVTSNSSVGRGSVSVQLVEGADVDKSLIDVARSVERVRGRLPADAGTPTVNKADPNAFPIMNIVLSGRLAQDQLYDLATEQLQPRLQSLVGVADVGVSGGLTREVQITVDYARLEAYNLSAQQITNAITRENLNQPAGSISEGLRTTSVRTVGAFETVDQLGAAVITTTGGAPVLLRDVATVRDGFRERTQYQRYNGEESVGLRITKQSDANTLEVADNVRAELSRLETILPEGVRVVVTNDGSRFVRNSLEAVQVDLIFAVLLCGLVLWFFLHTLPNTIIVLLAIPTSLIATFLVMFALGFTLNTVSLMALALMVGILVDDSIVVLESIHRHLQRGGSPKEAALTGRNEVGLAAMAMTLVIVVVYVPVAFMPGNIGKLFREYGLTIAAAALLSLFMSFTLVPMLSSRWLKAREQVAERGGLTDVFVRWWDRNFDRLARSYGRLLALALRRRPLVLVVASLAMAGALAVIPLRLVGTEYTPQEDDSQMQVNLSLPVGTSLEEANAAALNIERRLQSIPEVEAIYTTVSSGAGGGPAFFGGQAGARAEYAVQLKDRSERSRSVFDILNEVRRLGTDIPGAQVRGSVQSPLGGGGGGSNVQLRIQGDDLETLTRIGSQVEEAIRQVPGVVDVTNSAQAFEPEVRVTLNRQRMAEVGITTQQVAQTLRTALGGTVVGQLRPEGKTQREITLRGSEADRTELARLADVPIVGTGGGAGGLTPAGAPVRLGQVARIERGEAPRSIARADRQRVITLGASTSGRALGDVARDIRQATEAVALPIGYRYSFTGQVQQLDLALAALISALGLSVIMIYMVLVALYESWLHPLAIMFSLPVSLVGAFFGLWITGNTFNIFSMIGLIMLMGIVAKNAILLVDYTNLLRAGGMARLDALLEAARVRLRPILMTTATIIFAMIPLALKLQAGAESRSPMAVVVIGGVISSTLLTLVLVPTVYTYFDDLQTGLKLTAVQMFRRRRPMVVERPEPVPPRVPQREPAA